MMKDVLYEIKSDDSGYIYFDHRYCKEGEVVRLHVHNAVEFQFIVSGEYHTNIGGEEKTLKDGEMAFVDSRRAHTYRAVAKTEKYVLVVGREILSTVCPKGKIFPVYIDKSQKFSEIKAMLEKTFVDWNQMNKRERRGFGFSVLGTILQYYDVVDEKHDKKEDVVAQILEYVEMNYAENITLESLAKEFGYTKNYFSNLFNEKIGMNVREYVNRCRISRAVQIKKENPEMPFWSVAEKVGYESLNTFSRAYKRYAADEAWDKKT